MTTATQLADAARAYRQAKAIYDRRTMQSEAHHTAAEEAEKVMLEASAASRAAYRAFIDVAREYADGVEREADHAAEAEWPER
jgi:hypothetical protein